MNEDRPKTKEEISQTWRYVFELGAPELQHKQARHLTWPATIRCKLCFAPFDGEGAQEIGLVPSQRNGYFCNECDIFIAKNLGGAKVTLSILFIDVRNSVGIAEEMDPDDFRELMNEFFVSATLPLQKTEGFIIEFIGDAVACVYPPAFCGDHSCKAIHGAERVLRARMPTMPGGGELPIGVGVHTGIVSMGTVMSALRERGTYHDVQPFGDNVNVTSRLCGHAETRHALISESTLVAAGVPTEGLELRKFTVRGRKAPVSALAINRDWDALPTRSPGI